MKTSSINQFFNYCENNDPKLGIEIANMLIDSMIMSNPDRKDMSRADWLNYVINEYECVHTESGIDFQPKVGEADIDILII